MPCVISRRSFLAFEDAARNAHPLDDDRRAHFEIIGVVRQDPLDIVSVPGRDPLERELSCPVTIDHVNQDAPSFCFALDEAA